MNMHWQFDMDFCLHRFFCATRFLFFLFFVSVTCARLRWPPGQFSSARKCTVLYRIRIVSYCRKILNPSLTMYAEFIIELALIIARFSWDLLTLRSICARKPFWLQSLDWICTGSWSGLYPSWCQLLCWFVGVCILRQCRRGRVLRRQWKVARYWCLFPTQSVGRLIRYWRRSLHKMRKPGVPSAAAPLRWGLGRARLLDISEIKPPTVCEK